MSKESIAKAVDFQHLIRLERFALTRWIYRDSNLPVPPPSPSDIAAAINSCDCPEDALFFCLRHGFFPPCSELARSLYEPPDSDRERSIRFLVRYARQVGLDSKTARSILSMPSSNTLSEKLRLQLEAISQEDPRAGESI